jgi:hypothetical protein
MQFGNVRNTDALTLGLAISYHVFNCKKDWENNMVIVYSDRLILDQAVYNDIRRAIENAEPFKVTNESIHPGQ